MKNGKLLRVAMRMGPTKRKCAKDLLDQTEANSSTIHGEQLATVGP